MNTRTCGFVLPVVLALSLAACEAGAVRGLDAGTDAKGIDVVFGEVGEDAEAPEDTPVAADDSPDDVLASDAPLADAAEADALPLDAPPDEGPADAIADTLADATDPGLEDVPADLADTGPAVPQPEKTIASASWDRIDRYCVDNPGIVPAQFIDITAQTDAEVVSAFEDTRPNETCFLLHAAKGWDAGQGRVVVLVHGAGTDANASFATPDGASGASLKKALAEAGMRVFAVTFPHPFGSNDNQAIQLGTTLAIVRARTGASAVSLVAHSKGGLATLAYLKGAEAKWDVPFAGDVDRAVFLGAPLGGMDWSFRHPGFDYAAELFELPMPTAWDKVLEYGSWKDITERSIYGGGFPGLLEALRPWRDVYPLCGELGSALGCVVEQDWLTTYEGGTGWVSHSRGILEAIVLGGSWMDHIDALPAPATVSVAAGAGENGYMGAIPWETTGPSDGAVFRDSALDLSTFEKAGAPILEKRTFALLNHWELLYGADAIDFVLAHLTEEGP